MNITKNPDKLVNNGARLQFLKAEEKRLSEDMAELREKAAYFSSSQLSHSPKAQGGKRDVYAEFLVSLENLETIMLANLHSILKERLKLEQDIGRVKDVEMRLLLRLRLINGLNWFEIGEEFNTDRTSAAKKFKRILKI